MKRMMLTLLLFAGCKTEPVVIDEAPPPLGTRIFDRTGRPAINTALVGIIADRGTKDIEQQKYNEAGPEEWPSFATEIANNLAIYDALDAVCGNQFLAGPAPAADRYATLANALADDRLFLNSDATVCTQYLAVELNATTVSPNQDCGGRTPAYDVIDATYSVLALGAVSGVTDGIDADRKPPELEFPFFVR